MSHIDQKQALRQQIKAQRDQLQEAARRQAAEEAANHAGALLLEQAAVLVGAYYPVRGELDTLPLLMKLQQDRIDTALPVATQRDHPLLFRPWQPGEPLEKGAFSIPQPADRGLSLAPDVLIIPLLGFDETGARLGYGGGYYDRTLARLRAQQAVVAIGYAYAFQQVDTLPSEPHDQPLDWIVTDKGALRVRS